MLTKKQKFKRTALIFSILAIAIFLFAGGGQLFSIVQLPPDVLPYGESELTITGLNLVSDSGQVCGGSGCIDTNIYSSEFWDITTIASSGQSVSNRPEAVTPSGDDFDIYLSGGLSQEYGGYSIEYQTTNTFGKGKDFRTEFYALSGEGQTATFKFKLVTPSTTINLPNKELNGNALLEIKSSPVVDVVEIYYNGLLVQTATISEPFKVNIQAPAILGHNQAGVWFSGKTGIKNSGYKDAYNCNVKPDEQYYKKYFMEGSTVSKSKLENFNHWCLDTSPLEIYTNSGKTVDRMVIVALENGNTYPVPSGQIWAIEYIGDKNQLITPCEQDEVLINGDTCTARTVLDLQFLCAGGILNTATGECIPTEEITNETQTQIILETQAVDYIQSDIQTYQFLAENSKFRFTVIQDDNTMTVNSFDLFGQTFMSEIPSSPLSASFSYGTQSGALAVGDIYPLDERLKVKLSRVELQPLEDVSLGDTQKFLVEWTFELNTQFLVPSYDAQNKEIKINNSYYPFTGGLSITKKTAITTITDSKRAEFLLGETRIPIDTTGLREFSVRPFIEIITPDAEFRIATSIPMTVSDLQETQAIIHVPTQITTKQKIPLEKTPEGGKGELSAKKGLSFGIIAGIVGGILVGLGMIYFMIRSLIRPRRLRRR